MPSLRNKTILANAFHAPAEALVEHLEQVLIAIGDDGLIEAVVLPQEADHAARLAEARENGTLVEIPAGSYLLPGFVDLHVHAPQYPQLGQALDVPLEVWLHKYTFPLEARYADLDFARESYSALVEDLLALGTTTALYFATVHQEATRLLADICLARGQRALVGKVVMDDPAACPDYYRDASAQSAVADTRAFIDYVRSHPENAEARVLPVVTPRFIPSCTNEALAGLGQLVRECGCHVQTHCSESDWAHGHVLERFGKTDAESLDGFGLLTSRSVLAHSNFLTDADMDRLAERGAGVAHCAVSNAYFANSVFLLRAALEKGVHVGLGTDVSGGPTNSLFEAARMTIHASRMLETGVDPARPPAERGRPDSAVDFRTAFHLATAGGGKALDLPIGLFVPGYHFDAMLIDTTAPAGTIRILAPASPDDVLQKIIYTTSKGNIARVWVGGQQVV